MLTTMTKSNRSPKLALLSLVLALGATSACDKGDEEAKKKQEQEFVDKIIAQVDKTCACTSQSCTEDANRKITTLQEEAKEKLGGHFSTEAHRQLLPHMERVGQCLAKNL